MNYRVTPSEWRDSNGVLKNWDGYNIHDYAKAAGVEIEHDTQDAAEQAARKIQATPDVDGVYPVCEVVAQ